MNARSPAKHEKRPEELPLTNAAVENGELLGQVVIDSRVAGRACGGVRFQPEPDEAELRALARTQTLKYGFLGLPQGGGKAGVVGDPEAPRAERLERLAAFARAIAPVLRRREFAPFPDLGTRTADIRHLLRAADVRPGPHTLRDNRSGEYTAVSVMAGVRAAARHVGLELPGCTAAIEGFGKVGGALAGLLDRAGVKVVAVSTSRGAIYHREGLEVGGLRRLASQVGSRVVEPYGDSERLELSELHELPVDVLCPCARRDSIRADNASRVRARVVCPGANNPVTAEARGLLHERDVLFVPDFVANCGGVLGGTMAFASMRPAAVAEFLSRELAPAIAALLRRAAREGVPPYEVAERVAVRRFARVRERAAHPGLLGRLFGLGLGGYRRGLVPSWLVRARAPAYFRRLPVFREAGGGPTAPSEAQGEGNLDG
jgi:glutamate dehydrogenase/leucine dehydrogenase